jgi:hypothetical protein
MFEKCVRKRQTPSGKMQGCMCLLLCMWRHRAEKLFSHWYEEEYDGSNTRVIRLIECEVRSLESETQILSGLVPLVNVVRQNPSSPPAESLEGTCIS